jgi:hypothetical protein
MGNVSELVLSILFLAVSVTSLVVQTLALRRLYLWPDTTTHRSNLVYRGLLRTSLCRVIAAILYVGFGVVALTSTPTLPVMSLAVFTFVQLLWQTNAVADVRLRGALAGAARHSQREGDAREGDV